jgi:hypothetical protein
MGSCSSRKTGCTEWISGPLGYIRHANHDLVATTPMAGWDTDTTEPDSLPYDNAPNEATKVFAFSSTGLWSASLSSDNWIYVSDHRKRLSKALVRDAAEGSPKLAVNDTSVWCFRVFEEDRWTIKGWDIATGCPIRAFAGVDGRPPFEVSPDDRIAMFSDGLHSVLQLWSLQEGSRLRNLHGHTASIQALKISADNRTAVSGLAIPQSSCGIWRQGLLIAFSLATLAL